MLLKPMDNQYERQACRSTKRSVWLLRCTTTRHKISFKEGLSSARGAGINARSSIPGQSGPRPIREQHFAHVVHNGPIREPERNLHKDEYEQPTEELKKRTTTE